MFAFKRSHGTCDIAVQDDLNFGVSFHTSDRIACFNKRNVEVKGYAFQPEHNSWISKVQKNFKANKTTQFLDSVSGLPVIEVPVDRTDEEFIDESRNYGWLSIRDKELNRTNVVIEDDGRTVSVNGTHLGYNFPDTKGNRYSINLVSVAGNPI